MIFKVVLKINPIGVSKTFTKINYNICTTEFVTILKNLCHKRVVLMKKLIDIWVLPGQDTSYWFILSTNDIIIG